MSVIKLIFDKKMNNTFKCNNKMNILFHVVHYNVMMLKIPFRILNEFSVLFSFFIY